MKCAAASRYAVRSIQEYVEKLTRYQQKIGRTSRISVLHDVRVSCRRLRTSLWIFKDFVPEAQRVVWKKNLKCFARSLGRARDLDVQIAFLKKVKPVGKTSSSVCGLRAYISVLCMQRDALTKKVAAASSVFSGTRTCESILRALGRVKTGRADSLRTLTKNRINKRLRELCAFERFVHQPEKLEALHRMRIAAKHLRYTLEILSPVDAEFMRFSRDARILQRVLGELHDFDVWIGQLRCARVETKPGFDKKVIKFLRSFYPSRRADTYKRFVKIWEQQARNKVWETLAQRLEH